MKRAICAALCLLVAGNLMCHAQKLQRPFYLGVEAGVMGNLYENAFSYVRNGQFGGLITMHRGLLVGYRLSVPFSVRAELAYDRNAGAANVQETGSGTGFYPYKFDSFNGFADFIFTYGQEEMDKVRPQFYLGLGGAYTFNYTDSGHPWQKIQNPSGAFGFRLGFMLHWRINPLIAVVLDIKGEGYTDMYNGLQPNKADQARVDGYAGFPLDLRGIAAVGVQFYL